MKKTLILSVIASSVMAAPVFVSANEDRPKHVTAVYWVGSSSLADNFCAGDDASRQQVIEEGRTIGFVNDSIYRRPTLTSDRFKGLSEAQQKTFRDMGGILYEEACNGDKPASKDSFAGSSANESKGTARNELTANASLEDVVKQAMEDKNRGIASSLEASNGGAIELESVRNNEAQYSIQEAIEAFQLVNCSQGAIQQYLKTFRGNIRPITLDAENYIYLDTLIPIYEKQCQFIVTLAEEANVLSMTAHKRYSHMSPTKRSYFTPMNSEVTRNDYPKAKSGMIRGLPEAGQSSIQLTHQPIVAVLGDDGGNASSNKRVHQAEASFSALSIKFIDIAKILNASFEANTEVGVYSLFSNKNLVIENEDQDPKNERSGWVGGYSTRIQVKQNENLIADLKSQQINAVSEIPLYSLQAMGAEIRFGHGVINFVD